MLGLCLNCLKCTSTRYSLQRYYVVFGCSSNDQIFRLFLLYRKTRNKLDCRSQQGRSVNQISLRVQGLKYNSVMPLVCLVTYLKCRAVMLRVVCVVSQGFGGRGGEGVM